jgi:hypothetical protein
MFTHCKKGVRAWDEAAKASVDTNGERKVVVNRIQEDRVTTPEFVRVFHCRVEYTSSILSDRDEVSANGHRSF